jgi:hypothetical protein
VYGIVNGIPRADRSCRIWLGNGRLPERGFGGTISRSETLRHRRGFHFIGPVVGRRRVGVSRRAADTRAGAIEVTFGGIALLLDQNKFVIKSQSKKLSSKKSFEIVDGGGQLLGTAAVF